MAFNELGFIYEGVFAVCAAHYSVSDKIFSKTYYTITKNDKNTTLDGRYNEESIINTLKDMSTPKNYNLYTTTGYKLSDTFKITKKANENKKILAKDSYLICNLFIKLPQKTTFFGRIKNDNEYVQKNISESTKKYTLIKKTISQFEYTNIAENLKNKLKKYVNDKNIDVVYIFIQTTGTKNKIQSGAINSKKLTEKSDILIEIKDVTGKTIEKIKQKFPTFKITSEMENLFNSIVSEEVRATLKVSSSTQKNTRIHNSVKEKVYSIFDYKTKNDSIEDFVNDLRDKKQLILEKLQIFLFGEVPNNVVTKNFFYNSIDIRTKQQLSNSESKLINEFTLDNYIKYKNKYLPTYSNIKIVHDKNSLVIKFLYLQVNLYKIQFYKDSNRVTIDISPDLLKLLFSVEIT